MNGFLLGAKVVSETTEAVPDLRTAAFLTARHNLRLLFPGNSRKRTVGLGRLVVWVGTALAVSAAMPDPLAC